MNLKLVARLRQLRALHDAFGQHSYVNYFNKDANAILRICKECMALEPNAQNKENFAIFISNCSKQIIDIGGKRINVVDFYAINNHILKYFPPGIWQFFDKKDILLAQRDDGLPSIYIPKAMIGKFRQRFGDNMDIYILTSAIEREL